MERIGKAAYRLLLPEGAAIHPVFHVSQLKKHFGSKAIPSRELPLIDDEGNVLVEPTAVLARRIIPRHNEPVVQWLIQWVNLPSEAATWEDASFITRIFLGFHP